MFYIIQLVAAVLAIFSFAASIAASIYKKQNTKKKFYKLLNQLREYLKILVPIEQYEIEDPIYNELIFTFPASLIQNSEKSIGDRFIIWVLAKFNDDYHIMYPEPIREKQENGLFFYRQTNIRLKNPGRWDLIICLTTKKANNWLQKRVDQENWSGFRILPKKMASIKHVTVRRHIADVWQRMEAATTIDVPKENQIIDTKEYDEMKGKIEEKLPDGYKLFVLIRDRWNFFVNNPSLRHDERKKIWNQTNIKFGEQGRWELHLCLANKNASDWLEKKINANDYSGFRDLPTEMQSLHFVVIKHIFRSSIQKRLNKLSKKTNFEDQKLTNHASQLKKSGAIKIIKPHDNQLITSTDLTIEGEYSGETSQEYDFWIFKYLGNHYYADRNPIMILGAGKWAQRHVSIKTPKDTEFYVCVTNKYASELLKMRREYNLFSGFTSLPPSIIPIASVKIRRA